MVATSDGGLLAAGSFQGTITLGPDSASPVSLTGAPDENAFVAHFTADGNVSWAEYVAGASTRSLALLSDGRAAIAGLASDTATFDPDGPSEPAISSNEGPYVGYVAWYGADGSFEKVAAIADYPDWSMSLLAGPLGSTHLFGTGRVAITSNGATSALEDLGLYRCVFASDGSIDNLDLLAEAASSLDLIGVAPGIDGDVFMTGNLRGRVILAPGRASEVLEVQHTAQGFIAALGL